MSNLQILCTTMQQNDLSLIKKMNIHSDVVFANQANTTRYDELEFDGYKAKMITTQTRGVGINRNVALMYATNNICLFADDDMVYVDEYDKIITKAFEQMPDADAIVFDVMPVGGNETRIKHTKYNSTIKKVHYLNCLKYATLRMSVKTDVIMRENLWFHTSFGGGTKYSSGEDTLFIWNMLKHKLKIYSYPAVIADVYQDKSTWFEGYNEKFLFDKGALYCALSKSFAKLLCLQALIRHSYIYKQASLTFMQAYTIMKKGIIAFKNNKTYAEYKEAIYEK